MKSAQIMTWCLAVVVMTTTASVHAQTDPPVVGGTETIDFDRPEAWAMKWFASVTLFTSLGPPAPREARAFSDGLR